MHKLVETHKHLMDAASSLIEFMSQPSEHRFAWRIPTAPGFYWYAQVIEGGALLEPVVVRVISYGIGKPLRVEFTTCSEVALADCIGAWSARLDPPSPKIERSEQ